VNADLAMRFVAAARLRGVREAAALRVRLRSDAGLATLDAVRWRTIQRRFEGVPANVFTNLQKVQSPYARIRADAMTGDSNSAASGRSDDVPGADHRVGWPSWC
jgi:hypothetical protein